MDILKERAAQLFSSQFEITEGTFMAIYNFVDKTAVRNYMIRQEAQCICHHHTKEEAITILADRYNCSEPTVRAVIYNQSKK